MANTQQGIRKPTSIWLEPEIGVKKLFKCFNCSIPVAQYTGNVTKIVPGEAPVIPSVSYKCKGNIKPLSLDATVDICKACNGRGYFTHSKEPFQSCGMYYSFVSSVHTQNPELT